MSAPTVAIHGLEQALEYSGGTHDMADVLDQVEEGKAQMWKRRSAVIVTEIHQYPRQKVCHFWLATGELSDVIGLHREIVAWAKAEGCDRATLAGRKGWVKALRDEGWNHGLVLMDKELTDG